MLMLSLVATGFIGYMYMIILTMAIYVIYVKDSWSCESPPKFISYTQIFIAENKLNKYLLNTAFIYFSGYFVCFYIQNIIIHLLVIHLVVILSYYIKTVEKLDILIVYLMPILYGYLVLICY